MFRQHSFGELLPAGRIVGKVRGGYYTPQGSTRFHDLRYGDIWLPGTYVWRGEFGANLVMYDWATIVAENLRNEPTGKNYSIAGMYLEFENNAGAPVSPPSFGREDGKSYYDSLSTSSNRDYLRVSLAGAILDSTDATKFPGGNRLQFIAQSSGVAGVHGKTFSDTVSSRVFGGALVAMPDPSDDTQDLVFSRFYFSNASEQLIKEAGSEITLTWPIELL